MLGAEGRRVVALGDCRVVGLGLTSWVVFKLFLTMSAVLSRKLPGCSFGLNNVRIRLHNPVFWVWEDQALSDYVPEDCRGHPAGILRFLNQKSHSECLDGMA